MSDGLFTPDLPRSGEVADPDRLADAFRKAEALARKPTHYQFAEGGFTDPELLDLEEHNRFFKVSQSASLQATDTTWPLIPDDAGASANLWKIPHNRGWDVIGDPDDRMEYTWTSAHPEMLIVFYSVLYVRRDVDGPKDGAATGWTEWADFFSGSQGRNIRAQVGLELDGIVQQASGPFCRAQDGKTRGTGIGSKSAAFSFMGIFFLEAGTHSLRLVAAQAPAWSNGEAETDSEQYVSTALDHGVCIGNRTMFGFLQRYGKQGGS